MYIPKPFGISDRPEVVSFIQNNAFGELVSSVAGRLFASHLPFLFDERENCLYAHLAKPNPQSRELAGQEALVIFQGPHGYVSPSWYLSSGVPTWNYQVVHIYGQCRVFDEPVKLKWVIDTLSEKYESGYEKPWQPDYEESLLKGILGLEIRIDEIQCKYKLSQNRSAKDRVRVIEKLKEFGSNKLAQAMEWAMRK